MVNRDTWVKRLKLCKKTALVFGRLPSLENTGEHTEVQALPAGQTVATKTRRVKSAWPPGRLNVALVADLIT